MDGSRRGIARMWVRIDGSWQARAHLHRKSNETSCTRLFGHAKMQNRMAAATWNAKVGGTVVGNPLPKRAGQRCVPNARRDEPTRADNDGVVARADSSSGISIAKRWSRATKKVVVCATSGNGSGESVKERVQTVGWATLAAVALTLAPTSAEAGIQYEKKPVAKTAEETSASFPLLATGATVVAGAPIAALVAGGFLNRKAPKTKGTQKIRARANAPVSKPKATTPPKTKITAPSLPVSLPGTVKKTVTPSASSPVKSKVSSKPASRPAAPKAKAAAVGEGGNKFVEFFLSQAGVGTAVLAAIVVGTKLASDVSVPAIQAPSPPPTKPETPAKSKPEAPPAKKLKEAPSVAEAAPVPKVEAPKKVEETAKPAKAEAEKAAKVVVKEVEKKTEEAVKVAAPAEQAAKKVDEKKVPAPARKTAAPAPAKPSSSKLTAEEAAARKAAKKEANDSRKAPATALLALTAGIGGFAFYINKSASEEGSAVAAAPASPPPSSSPDEVPGDDAPIPVRVEDRKKWIAAWRKRTSA